MERPIWLRGAYADYVLSGLAFDATLPTTQCCRVVGGKDEDLYFRTGASTNELTFRSGTFPKAALPIVLSNTFDSFGGGAEKW